MQQRNLYKLNQRFVDALPYSEGTARIYFDDAVKGFGVSVGRTSKSYIVQREVNRRSVRVTIGRTQEMTVSKAREEASKVLLGMRNGDNPNQAKKVRKLEVRHKKLTLQQLLDQHVEALRLKGCEASVERYPRALELHVGDWLSQPVEMIGREHVIERHRKIGSKVGTRTANAVFRMLRALYNQYRIDHQHFQNPVEILSLKKLWFPEKPRDTRIKPHEIQRWMKALNSEVKNPVHKDYIAFTLLNGLRKNEAMHLAWDKIDFVGKTFRIEKTKNKKPLELPFTKETEALLLRMQALRDMSNAKTEKWVFPSELSSAGNIHTVYKSLALVNKHTKLNIRLHDLRRTFVSIANSIGIPNYTIKKIVNHSTAGDVTASVYNVMDIEDLRKPMQRISDEFAKQMNQSFFETT